MNLIALRSPEFRLYFGSAVCAVNGMWILRIIIGWLSWDISGSATFVGTVAAASLLPTVFFGPFFGVLVDRANVIRAAFFTNIGMTACVAALLLLQVNDLITPLSLIAVASALGTVTAAHHPVRLSLGPRLVRAEYVSSVVALAALNFNLARLLSPALGGLLIERVGVTAAIVVTLVAFIPNLAILPRLHPREKAIKQEKERFLQAFVLGLQYLWHRPALRLVILATAVFSIAIRGVLDILPIIADGVFGLGAIGLGQLGSAVGAGALCAAFIKTFGRITGPASTSALSPVNTAAAVTGILAMGLLGTTGNWGLALFAAVIMGFSGTHLGVGMQSLIQADLPDDMRGRVMSIWVVVGLGGAAAGAIGVGTFAEIVGLPAAAITTSALGLAAIIYIFIRSR